MARKFTNATPTGGGSFGTTSNRRRAGGGSFGTVRGAVSSWARSAAPQPKSPSARKNAASSARYNRPTPQPKSSPSYGGGGSYGGGSRSYSGGGGGGGGGGVGSLSVQSAIPSKSDYLKGDATYQATISALAKQLTNFNTDIDTQLSNRKVDYDKALQQLGYIMPAKGATEGTWNFEDQMTAAGRAYQAMLNDFASRGMIQSSGYGEAQNDLTRTLNEQFKGLETSNKQFIDDTGRQKTKAADENTAAQQAARAEAILRRAAQYGFGG